MFLLNNNKNNNWFLYSAFLVWDTTKALYSVSLPPVNGFNINPALIHVYSARSQLAGEHSGQAPPQGRTHAKSSDKYM